MSTRRRSPLLVAACFALLLPAAGAAQTANPPSGVEQYEEEIPTATGPATKPSGDASTTPPTTPVVTPPPTGVTSTDEVSTSGQVETEGSTQETGTSTAPLASPGAGSDDDGSNPLVWVGTAMVLLALLLGAVAVNRRRRGPPRPDTP